MIAKNQIDVIMIKVESGGKERFYLVLDSKGSITRSGSGRMADTDGDIYVGITKEPVFQKVINSIDEKLLGIGSKMYTIPCKCKEDIPCKLTLCFQVGQQNETMVFTYGYRCGLPHELGSLLKSAFEFTQPWYESQKNKKLCRK